MRLGKNVIRALMVSVLMIAGDLARGATPNLLTHIDRPLRYKPEAGGFVIENGPDSFNRPLYGGNTAFRADAGDKPEFSLYVPGRGGNLRVGIRSGAAAKWLREMQTITTRYQDGAMKYEIRDPLFGAGSVKLEALGLNTTEGVIVRLDPQGLPEGAEMIFAFGGANGDRGSRSGDIGTEREPVSRFFALRPEYCRDNRFDITGNSFILQSKPAPGKIAGIAPQGSTIAIGDATKWESPAELLASAGKETPTPVIVGYSRIAGAQPMYLALQRLTDASATQPAVLEAPRVSSLQDGPQAAKLLPIFAAQELAGVFEKTQQHFRAISHQVEVDTPDPFINAAVPALCLAADALWDEPDQAVMHGGVAWRTKLLGWRGPYSADAIGRHDRLVKHLNNWLPKQNTDPVSDAKLGADADSDLARSEAMLHSNGDLSRSHYDMNTVAIDALFRHLLWTGDIEYARSAWPVIKRHLAWEQRLFRREFGPEKLPLYEAYAVIWASDDLGYSGGGATHSTAYNYWHNVMAARLAKLLGDDPAPYTREAELILKAMNQLLWLPDRGTYAECKDLLGNQLVHQAPALWTGYHAIDSHTADPFQRWQIGRYVDTNIAHIPLKGPGVPEGYFNLASSNWMPYTWSINNIAMAETVHTALSDFQSGRNVQAFAAFKGALLDSMFIGQCPGNVHMCSYFDPYRRESQRDSGDPTGITCRTLVEGLFGIEPDALNNELTIRPGFPSDWDHASIKHPDLTIHYKRITSTSQTFTIESRFLVPMQLRLRVPVFATEIVSVTIDGQPATWKNIEDSIGTPRIEIASRAAQRWQVEIRTRGEAPATLKVPPVVAGGRELTFTAGLAKVEGIVDPQRAFTKVEVVDGTVRGVVSAAPGHRTALATVRHGQLSWLLPIEVEIRDAMRMISAPTQTPDSLRFRIQNNTASVVEQSATVRAGMKSLAISIKAPAFGETEEFAIPADGFVPGSNPLVVELGAASLEGVVTNWKIQSNLSKERLESVDLTTLYNDRVTQIFKNRYVSPRSPFTSLSLPADGIGGWATFARTAEIDDAGLRAAAARNNGNFLVQGIPFRTPGAADAKNIAFTSQWHNYPREVSVPLTGKASHAYFMLAGSTNPMQSRIDNGQVVVTYTDGSSERLALTNPTNWWPIEQDYFVDDYSFARPEPVPPRIDLRTGRIRIADPSEIKGQREMIPGGAGLVLDLPLDPQKELRSVTVRAIANDVVIGLLSATLVR